MAWLARRALRLRQSFTLAEIRELLGARGSSRRGWTVLTTRKIAELDVRIAEMQGARTALEHALQCRSSDLLTCPHFRSALRAAQPGGLT